eukprot:5128522-Pyramimonas_sp.AAC.1
MSVLRPTYARGRGRALSASLNLNSSGTRELRLQAAVKRQGEDKREQTRAAGSRCWRQCWC